MQGFPFDSQLTFDDENLPVYDRAVSSQPLRKLIRDLFTTGVMPNPSTNLQVSSGLDGMTVQVQAGFAVIDGGLCQETETRTLEVTAADTTYDRIDTVVVRWNENVDVRTADLYVVAGTPSATPVRPALQRDNSIYEIGLADIFVTKRVATITDDKITDTRYEAERCGIVSSVSEWDTTTIYQQIQADLAGFKADEQAEFITWFNEMKGQLSEDAAGHLQVEVDDLDDRLTPFETAIQSYTNGLGTASIKNIGDGTLLGAVSQINQNLSDKVDGFTDSTYSAVTGLAYDSTNKKLGLKVGADTVIPFSGGFEYIFQYVNYINANYVFAVTDKTGHYSSFTTYANAADHIVTDNAYIQLRQVSAHRHIITIKKACKRCDNNGSAYNVAAGTVIDSSTFYTYGYFALFFE